MDQSRRAYVVRLLLLYLPSHSCVGFMVEQHRTDKLENTNTECRTHFFMQCSYKLTNILYWLDTNCYKAHSSLLCRAVIYGERGKYVAARVLEDKDLMLGYYCDICWLTLNVINAHTRTTTHLSLLPASLTVTSSILP